MAIEVPKGEHTKEPWYCNPDPDHDDIGIFSGPAYETVIADASNEDVQDREIVEANARRIVACVNACKGIPTEYLETKGIRTADYDQCQFCNDVVELRLLTDGQCPECYREYREAKDPIIPPVTVRHR